MSESDFPRKFKREVMEIAADLAELCYRGDAQNTGRDCAERKHYGGDLLYRFAKLQAAHYSQLARMGIAQAGYARHLMDAWYGTCSATYCDEDRYSDEIRIIGKSGADGSQVFLVTNRGDTPVSLTFQLTSFKKVGGSDQFNDEGHAFQPDTLELAPNRAAPVALGVTLTNKFLKGEKYLATVKIVDGSKVIEKKTVCVEAT